MTKCYMASWRKLYIYFLSIVSLFSRVTCVQNLSKKERKGLNWCRSLDARIQGAQVSAALCDCTTAPGRADALLGGDVYISTVLGSLLASLLLYTDSK